MQHRKPSCAHRPASSSESSVSVPGCRQQLAAAASGPMGVQGQGMVPEWRAARMLAATPHLALALSLLAPGHVSARVTAATSPSALPPPICRPPSGFLGAPQPLPRLAGQWPHKLRPKACSLYAHNAGPGRGRHAGGAGASAAEAGGVARLLCMARSRLELTLCGAPSKALTEPVAQARAFWGPSVVVQMSRIPYAVPLPPAPPRSLCACIGAGAHGHPGCRCGRAGDAG